MKPPRYLIILLVLLLIFQGVQMYQSWRNKSAMLDNQKDIISALKTRHDKEIAFRDSLLAVHAYKSLSEGLKIDSLTELSEKRDEAIKNLKNSNYQLKKQKDAITAQLDSLSNYTRLPKL